MSASEIAKHTGAFCVGATALAFGMTAGAMVGAVALVNMGVIWQGMKSACVETAKSAATDAALAALERNREFSAEDLDAAAALLKNTPPTAVFDPSKAVHRLANGSFETETASDLIAAINPGDANLDAILRVAFEAGLKACTATKRFREEMAWDVNLKALREISDVKTGVFEANTKLDRIEALLAGNVPTADLYATAQEFGYTGPPTDTEAMFRILKEAANQITEMERTIAELRATAPELENVLLGIEAALDAGDIHTVRTLLPQLESLVADEQLRQELDRKAKVLEVQARAALLEGDDAAALPLLTRAAQGFAALSNVEMASRLGTYADILYDRGLLFPGPAMAGAVASRDQAAQALEPGTEDWAMIQNNLGGALMRLGERGNADALTRAVSAYEAALTVYTKDAMPEDWAGTKNNLGNALQTLGQRGDADALTRAVSAYEAALTIYTRARMPVQWATTQNNLGTALLGQGQRGGTDALSRAVTAYDAALIVYNKDAMPVLWAITRENMAHCYEAMGDLPTALTAVEDALTVFDPETMPYNHDKAARLRDQIRTALPD